MTKRNLETGFGRIFMKKKDLYYRLMLSTGLFFIFPTFGFLFFAVKYDIIQDSSLPVFLSGFLVFSVVGFFILRTVFTRLTKVSAGLSERAASELSCSQSQDNPDELGSIVDTFNAVGDHLRNTLAELQQKTSEISTLKELSDLCYVTFDTDELFYITLERALKLVKADVGSVMILDRPKRKTFRIKAQIGLGDGVKVESAVAFDTSIAKYAVINKSALLVEDIEKDSRFGRSNRSPYSTKSFICMPLKTIGDIIGVINISRRNNDTVFTQHDVEVLTPLLSNAAFTYENIRLFKENELGNEIVRMTINMFKTINSSLKDSELIYAILHEIQSIMTYNLAVILTCDDNRPDELTVFDFSSKESTDLSREMNFNYRGTIFDKVMQQGTTLLLEDVECLTEPVEKKIFCDKFAQSAIVTALRVSGEVKGVMVLCAPSLADLDKGAQFIDVARDSVAFVVERIRLSASVSRRNQQLDTLKQIGSSLAASTFNIDEVLKYAMDMIRGTMEVEAGSLFLVRNGELEFKITFGVDVAVLEGSTIKLGQGIAGYAAAQGKSIMVNDAQNSPHFFPSIDMTTGFKTRSVLCVPMISQGKVMGIIELLNKQSGDFVKSDEDLLRSIISSLVVAVENSRLYAETVSMAEHERGIRQIFQKFVPSEVVDKIIHAEAAGASPVNEFRSLTFLNIDIRGFSKLAKNIGPHRTVPMINYFFSVMGEIVFRHQGIVDKYLGDGFLALFGAPISNIADADNAIFASLEMKSSMKDVSDYFLKEIGVPLSMGISIHTGDAVIGNIGFDKKMDYTVIGDAVNTVFRLQSLAKPFPNGILISDRTRKAAQYKLDLKEVGEYEIDAALEKVKVYEVLDYLRA
ncbi:MAG: GAF domain-containing protein [Syntrophorhabdaceae bacterium]|nr:GAF domain-containing protein [Syntrophorhabdaceae bacterium]